MSTINGPENLGALQIEANVENLLLNYRGYSPKVQSLLTETGPKPYPPENNFDPGAYFQIIVAIDNPDRATVAEIKTPVHTEDPNMVRLFREKALREEIMNPLDSKLLDSELLEHFQFPKFIAERTINDKIYGDVPVSIMYEYAETQPLGSVQLVTPGILLKQDMKLFARLIHYIQRIGDNDRFAYNPKFIHRFMSYGPWDGN